ncbi:MAG: glycoside hydrolase family 99-like domain-containing protein [Clostridia bacterium]|nr:glycoside hydrolase family 99-like domain-containing protein [Clostridia bacterium]
MKRPAHYLISQLFHNMSWHDGVGSAWNYDNRGAAKMKTDRGPYPISNISGEFPTSITRELQTAKEGVFTLEATIVFSSGFDGFEMSFYDVDENDAMRIITQNGEFLALGSDNEYVSIYKPESTIGNFYFNIVLDFDEKTVTYYINQMWRATLPLLEKSFKYLKFGTLEGYKLDVEVKEKIDLHANYAVCDSFIHFPEDSFPFTWKKKGNCFINGDDELVIISKKGGKSTAKKQFSPKKGNLQFSTYYFNYSNGAKTTLNVKHGKTILFNITCENNEFYINSEKKRHFLDEMWYRLRFVLDTKKGFGVAYVNSKEPYEFTFTPMSIDCLEFSAFDGAELRIDDVKLEYIFEYDDYCPKPVVPIGYGDYTIGINMHSLWKTGHHIGWDCITPFPEIKPILGYYDEGLPEVADWEIKFMAENGINTQYYCWYLDNYTNKPIKKTILSDALIDGYMNSKYSDIQQFSIIFDASGCQSLSSKAFRRYVIPFWIENFFSDRRFAKIYNKAIMCFNGMDNLLQCFGGVEKLNEEIVYLKSQVKKLGYDDLIIFTNHTPDSKIATTGIDACYSYDWGKMGFDLDYQIQCNENMQKLSTLIHFIPTASTGSNSISWDKIRSASISVDDFKALLYHIKDNLLPKFKDKPEWAKKFIMLSSWNEFGAGNYICPSGLNEFGYLEAVREVFTGGCASQSETNIKPCSNQLKRLSTLYPQDRKTIRCLEKKQGSKNGSNCHLYINDEQMILDNDIIFDNGHCIVSAFPERMIFYRLNCLFKWNYHKKHLQLFANHSSIEFFLGTRKAKINGETVTLDCVPYFDNGLPMIPIDVVCRVFGYKFEEKNGNFYVTTPFNK